jgi:hypothetical protein
MTLFMDQRIPTCVSNSFIDHSLSCLLCKIDLPMDGFIRSVDNKMLADPYRRV